jgi:dTDP-4-amino-4,6-dideoxygalactose transaminase
MGMIKLPKNSIDYFKKNLDEIFQSGNLAEGQWNKRLEGFVTNLTDSQISVATNSNGAGLVALMSLYRHYHGRTKVMIQSNTMYGVKVMVTAAGCHLSGFIQCRLETLMPSLEDVEKSISKLEQKEKNEMVILLSHIGGIINPDIETISNLCKENNIILLEDCAHSFGATLHRKHSGLFGDAGVYSFYATKAIPAGEGGVVVTKHLELGEMISKYSIYDRFEQKLEVANNIRISEVQALLTFAIVKEWKNIVENKMKIADKYMKVCKQKKIKYITQNENGHFGNYYKFVILSPRKPIYELLPNLITKTSAVYDYSIGIPNNVSLNHTCLPIWFGQNLKVTEKVLEELKKSSTIK